MASLTRGLFHLHPQPLRPLLRPRSVLAELSHSKPRFFTTSFRAQAAQPKIKSTPSTSSQPPRTSSSGHGIPPNTSYGLIKKLAAKSTPTTLYEGPSHFWFYFGCWSSGLSILAWSALTGPTSVFQPVGVPVWVGWVYGVSYVLLCSMGFYLISKTPNIVRTIRVMPPPAAAKVRPAPVPAPVAVPIVSTPAASSPATLQIEVTVNRMLPFLEPKVLTTDLGNVALKSRFSLPEGTVPELRQQRRAEEVARLAQSRYDKEHLLTMPFRKVGRGFAALFNGVKAAWTDIGYGVIRVDGKEYKVNVLKGFAHEGFRTLERLVPVKPKKD